MKFLRIDNKNFANNNVSSFPEIFFGYELSHCSTIPTIWALLPAKTQISLGHYANLPMHYAEIFILDVKMIIFSSKFFDIFLIFAQNIDCGYTLEPPQ